MNFDHGSLQRIQPNEDNNTTLDRSQTNTPAQESFSSHFPIAAAVENYEPPQGSLLARLIPSNRWARLALAWSLLQLVVLLIAESIVISRQLSEYSELRNDFLTVYPNFEDPNLAGSYQALINVGGYQKALLVYQGLFVAAQIFQLYLSFDAILSSSKIHLVATTLFNLAVVIYSGVQYYQSQSYLNNPSGQDLLVVNVVSSPQFGPFVPGHSTANSERAVIALSVIFFAGWCAISVPVYKVFGWLIFKELGADVNVRGQLIMYHIYMVLVKLDVFFFFAFTTQYLVLVLVALQIAAGNSGITIAVNAIFLPFATIVLLGLAYFSVARESAMLLFALLVGLAGGMVYLIVRLSYVYINASDYVSVKSSLTLTIIATFLMCGATFVMAIVNYMNFGKGLMKALHRSQLSQKTLVEERPLNNI